jgi:hypothetical protein
MRIDCHSMATCEETLSEDVEGICYFHLNLDPLASPLEERNAVADGLCDLSEAVSIYFLDEEEMVCFGYAVKHFVLYFVGLFEYPSGRRGLTADWMLPWNADYGDHAADFENVFDAASDGSDIWSELK